ncbi:MAG: NINE protein [Chlorobiaceae bacterium]|nr:NINE protein [Chlorobiaceae bacterium]
MFLAVFFGWIGIHKFYLGNSRVGVFYLLFCWTLLPMIISLFEGFGYLFMGDDTFDGKYNQT